MTRLPPSASLALLVAVSLAGPGAAAQNLSAADSLALDAPYADWRLPHEADLERAMDPSCGRPPITLSGDFDGNGKLDRAALIVPADSADMIGHVQMVALLQKPARVEAIPMGMVGSGGWRVWKAGSLVDPFLEEEDVLLEVDGIEVFACEKAAALLYFQDGQLLEIVTGD